MCRKTNDKDGRKGRTRGEEIEKESRFGDNMIEGVHTEYMGLEVYEVKNAALYLELHYVDESSRTIALYFDNPKSADEIATQIAQNYEEHSALAPENETHNKEGETNEKQQVTEKAGDNTIAPATVEGAYLCLHQQTFEPSGET